MARCFFLVQNSSDLRYGTLWDCRISEDITCIWGRFTPALDDHWR
jgi:hypothetical protein